MRPREKRQRFERTRFGAHETRKFGLQIEHQDARLRDVSLGAFFPSCERIEIDKLRIFVIGVAMEPSAAVHVHQGLHTPGIQIVDMLVPQRDRQQYLW